MLVVRLGLFTLVAIFASCAVPPGEPALEEIQPSVLDATGGLVELKGSGFLPRGTYDFDEPSRSSLDSTVSAELVKGELVVPLTGVTLIDSTRVSAVVPSGLELGSWSVRLITPRRHELLLPDALRIEATLSDGGVDGGDVGDDAGVDDAGLDGGDDGGADGGADGGTDAGPQPCTDFTLLDDDGDGFGAPDSGALLCGPGRVLAGGDCNDVDALTSPSGAEVCNGLDDDCDGNVDELCADGGFTNVRDGGQRDYVSASAWAPDRLWIAAVDRLLVMQGDAGLLDSSTNCPNNLRSVWAAPSGTAFVGGGNNGVGRIATATRGAGCASSRLIPEPVVGMTGFPSSDGGTRVEMVLRDGRRVSWDGAGTPQVFGAMVPPGFVLYDAHGSSPDVMFAVGGTTGNPQRPAVFRFFPDGGVVQEQLPTQNVQDGQLHGVWVLSADEVVAVGDNGLVLRRVQGAWQRIGPPSMANYTTVRAFSIGRFYLSTEFGYLRQWSGRWSLQYTDEVPVRDLTAFDEEHFWLVGDNELIIHGPLP